MVTTTMMKTVVVVVVVCLAAVGVASSSAATSDTTPQQLHIALRGLGYDMAVSWYTEDNTATSTVQYGTKSGSYTNKATGSSDTYYKGYNHDAVLEGLEAATTYYYIVGDATGGWSSEASFTSPPAPNRDQSYTAAVYGDMGVDNSDATSNRLIAEKDAFDLFVHIGDFSYADDRLDTSKDFDKVWNDWGNQIEPVASIKPYMVNPGNHEATCHSFGDFFCPDGLKNFTAYNHRFRMPAKESGSNTNMWTSWNYGNTHWIMIDTETDYPHAPEGVDTIFKAGGFGDQLAWLEADLKKAAANRDQYPWIIATGHRPMYSAAKTGLTSIIWPNATGHLRAFVEDLFHEYNVDIYFCGHVHAYERQFPVYRGHVEQSYNNPTGLPQVVVGCAGNIEGHENKWQDPVPAFNAIHNGDDFGYGELTVVNSTQLKWVFRAADTGAIADEFTLNKDHPQSSTRGGLRGM